MSHFILLAIATAFCLATPLQADERPSSDKKRPEVKRIAKSNEELSALVVSAIDQEDYVGLMQLMLPASVLKDIGAPPDAQNQYHTYLQSIPKMAEQYRRYLAAEKWLPLAQWKFFELKSNEPENLNGITTIFSSGIRLTSADRKKGFELVDQCVAINGRSYVLRLCNEETEERLAKQKQDAKKLAEPGDARERR